LYIYRDIHTPSLTHEDTGGLLYNKNRFSIGIILRVWKEKSPYRPLGANPTIFDKTIFKLYKSKIKIFSNKRHLDVFSNP